jgi:hypothetical protein
MKLLKLFQLLDLGLNVFGIIQGWPYDQNCPRTTMQKIIQNLPYINTFNLSSLKLKLLLFQFKRKIKMVMVLVIHVNETKNLVMVQFLKNEKLVRISFQFWKSV